MDMQNEDTDLVQFSVNVARFFRQNLVVILVFTGLGLLSSLSIGFRKSQVFQSRMVLFSDLITKSYSEEMARNLNSIITSPGSPATASVLDLTPQEASSIHFVDFDFIPEKSSDKDVENATLIVKAEFSDRSILPKLQKAIINYLKENQFVKIRVEQRRIYYRKMISRIEREIHSLDSLKGNLQSGKPITSGSGIAFMDPSEMNKNIVDLYEQQLKYQNSLDVAESVQLVEGFTSVEKPPRLKFTVLALLGFLGGLSLALSFLGLRWVVKHSNS